MKIKTEILQSIFIITCEGPSLNASLAQEFLSAMNSFLVKSGLDIILDLSLVDFVDSTGLRSIIRSLRQIDGTGKLLLCGVDERVSDLLKVSRMDENFIQQTNRKAALSYLFWERKKTSSTPAPQTINKQPETPGTEKYQMQSMLWEVDEADFEIIEDTKFQDDKSKSTLRSREPKEERRKYRRIGHKQIMTDDFVIYCKNTTTGRHHPAVVLNISPGGLLITSRARLALGDELLLEGHIGKNFKFSEHAIPRACGDHQYGLEFIDLSPETNHFLNRLTGSVDRTKANRFIDDRQPT